MQQPIAFLFLLLAGVHASSLVLEKRDGPPPGFSRVGPTPLDQTLNLRLALTQNNIAGLQDTVYDISTPGNARYGQYLTQDEVNKFVAPSTETLSQVNSWLAAHGIASSPLTPAGDWISVNMSVSQANEMFAAEFLTFQNQDTNQTVVRTLSYSVPIALKARISWVHPTVNFPVVKTPSVLNLTSKAVSKRASTNTSVSADCRANASWTPACLQELYGIPSTPPQPAANFGVSGFQNGFANERDLKQFLEIYRPDMNPNTTFDLITLDGGINNQLPADAGIFEGADIQYAIGLTTGVPVKFISTGTLPDDIFTEMLDQAQFLVSMENPPQTIVNGNQGSLETQVSSQFAISLCNAYAQLAARGVSYIVNVGEGCTPPAVTLPFPATCPFVTAVGSTNFRPGDTEETADDASQGGFSDIFTRPEYQDATVNGYLESTGNINSTTFNMTGRAVPDVAAIGLVDFVWEGQVIDFLDGLSVQVFASIVALLTNERIAAGKPGLGFLNPLIYQNPQAFTDIKTGNNAACFEVVFNSTTGWDPVTGFGSPIYPALQEISSKL